MKSQYRIEHWRYDVDIQTIETPVFEGTAQENCDRQAVSRMEELSQQKGYGWDGLRVLRIDAPAVAEKSTFLADNGRQL